VSRFTHNPKDGMFITLDDLAEFVAEMRGYRSLPGDTVVRCSGHMEIDVANGPRVRNITADTNPPSENRADRRRMGQRKSPE
jgi:hypothetical protein